MIDNQPTVDSTRTVKGLANLRNSNALLTALDDESIISVCDLRGKITYVNENFCQLSQYSPPELLGKHHRITDSGTHSKAFWEKLWNTIQSGQTWKGQILIRAKDGSHHWLQTTILPIEGENARIEEYVTLSSKISAQQHTLNELRESEERFRGSFEFSGIGMAIVSLDGTWLQVNQSLLDMLGYEKEELLEMSFQDITHPDDLDSDLELLKETLAGKRRAYSMEKRYLDKSGSIIWAHLTVSLVRDTDGEPVHFVSQIENLTKSKKFVNEMKHVTTRLELAARAGRVGIWDYDPNTGHIVWDDQMFVLYGLKREEVKEVKFQTWEKALHPDDAKAAADCVRDAVAGIREMNTEFRVVWPDGTIRNLRALAIVDRNENGEPVRMVGTNWDVTDVVQQRQALIDMAKRAEAASQAKSQFLANMSHEIRTPINGVIGMTALLLDSPGLNAEQVKQAQVIQSSGEALMTVINDILDFSKIESGKLDLEILDFDLQNLLADTSAILALRAKKKHLKFTCKAEKNVPNRLIGDPARLGQALLNLAGNAIKFTQQGRVDVSVSLVSKNEKSALLRFSVKDTGIGISGEAIETLFDEFTQADPSTTRHYGGTGLGLAISKRLVALMDGEIEVSSQINEGSEFCFTLPLRYEKDGDSQSNHDGPTTSIRLQPGTRRDSFFSKVDPDHFSARKKRILLAEDNVPNQMVIRGICGKFGLHADIAANGLEALEALKRIDYDLVLMDVQMPLLDGLEACRRIREGKAGDHAKNIPIIALTAHASLQQREECLDAGMSEFVTKPVTPKVLFETLDRLLIQTKTGKTCMDDLNTKSCESPVFSWTQTLSLMMDDEALAKQVVRQSIIDLTKRRKEFEHTVQDGDLEDLHDSIHSVKGVSANVFCFKLNEFSTSLEAQLNEGAENAVRARSNRFLELIDEAICALENSLKK